ncbi:unnamed protein product [Boreogadus saida]
MSNGREKFLIGELDSIAPPPVKTTINLLQKTTINLLKKTTINTLQKTTMNLLKKTTIGWTTDVDQC